MTHPGPPFPGYAAPLPNHPQATTSMVLGIVGLASIVVCGGLLLVLSPFAWSMGSRVLREIDAEPQRWGGRDQANAGRIMGIVGTVLLVLAVLAIVLVIGLFVVVGVSTTTTTFPDTSRQADSPAGRGILHLSGHTPPDKWRFPLTSRRGVRARSRRGPAR